MSYYKPQSQPQSQQLKVKRAPLVKQWILDTRPLPNFQSFADELVLDVAYWTLDPRSLLNLSSTCKNFASILRTTKVWLSHHWGRGYDIGVLAKKAKRAAAAPASKYGPDGWGILVKSAFDKAEFPDDEHLTQWNMGKPLPHSTTAANHDSTVVERCQPRGEQWMRVLYDVLTEHERYNLELYPYLNDEALLIRVKATKYRYMQALISASDLLIRMWANEIGAITSQNCVLNAKMSLEELPPHDYKLTSLSSLTFTFLIANRIMQIDPAAQMQRRLYPHPPFGSSIWEGPDGEIDPKGLGWITKVMNDWKGTVYAMGQYTVIVPNDCPFSRNLKLGRAPLRMCLNFAPDGQITGRGGDFGGRFNIISGTYRKTFVELVKQYEDDDMETYRCIGHMTPWGVYGCWGPPDEPNTTTGYWNMWIFEGAPAINLGHTFRMKDGRAVLPKQAPYAVVPNWFEDYERERDAGEFWERAHGFWEDPPPQPEDVPLPEMDAFGL